MTETGGSLIQHSAMDQISNINDTIWNTFDYIRILSLNVNSTAKKSEDQRLTATVIVNSNIWIVSVLID